MDNNSINGGFPQPQPIQPTPQPIQPQQFAQPTTFPQPQQAAQPVGAPMVAGVGQPNVVSKANSERANHIHKIIQLVVIVVLAIAAITLATFLILTKFELDDWKTDVEGRIDTAVAEGRKNQKDFDEAEFAEREKNPYYEFVGPEDYGRVSFQYPKTWSQYVAKDGTGGDNFEAYLNPGVVDSVGDNAWSGEGVYALRVMVYNTDYESILGLFESWIVNGLSSSSLISAGHASGTRVDGYVSKNNKGAAFIFKLRDKTVVIRTDSEIFKGDFDKIINSIKYDA